MIRPAARVWASAALLGFCGIRAVAIASGAPAVGYVEDPGNIVAPVAGWTAATHAKLADFEQSHGIRILVQFQTAPPSPAEDQNPGDYMRALATKLEVIRGGVLMVHFAGDPDWRVWVGDELTPKFVGKTGNAKMFTENGDMHKAKEVYLNAAMAKAATSFTVLQKSQGVDRTELPARLLTLQADALIDGLCARLRR